MVVCLLACFIASHCRGAGSTNTLKYIREDQGKVCACICPSILLHPPQTVKGGMEIQYRALVTVGNLNGVGGFAIGKAISPAEAITEASR